MKTPRINKFSQTRRALTVAAQKKYPLCGPGQQTTIVSDKNVKEK